ncbi:hypothetical protein Patl1_26235 [Pistacia atlantica]|uniref:Uncharacterized protein n=1 Tax=Pistacia atlantica TaxID=434234 RepID=A0ACC1B1Y3_9ROSI|nr:hypothetical protein Patl1_26235 [Pistacia atlantica]
MGSAAKTKKLSKEAKPSLAPKQYKTKTKFKKNKNNHIKTKTPNNENSKIKLQPASASEQLSFFLNQFESANGVQLSSLELESIQESCIVKLSNNLDQDAETLGKHMKEAFGTQWKKELCEGQLVEGKVDPGCPAVLIISTSALRSIELLRGLRSMTKECHAVKLFSKHMKVEEQDDVFMFLMFNESVEVSLLKSRVNFASGTPSRIKKLIDIEALGLSRLAVIVLDMQVDLKGYFLFTLPQVRFDYK